MRGLPFPLAAANWSTFGNLSMCGPIGEATPGNPSTFYRDLTICLGTAIILSSKQNIVFLIDKIASFCFSLLCIILGLMVAPLGLVFLTVMALYREIARTILWHINSDNCFFIDLMNGADMFWALDNDISRSVINILVFIDFSFATNEGLEPLKTVKELMKWVILKNQLCYWKLSCFKKLSPFGYYYWVKQESLRMEDHVKWMTIGEEEMTMGKIEEFLTSIGNKAMPNNDQSLWEIFVGRGPVVGKGTPVIFRIHHSVGDGPSLIGILVESLARGGVTPHKPLPQSVSNREKVRVECIYEGKGFGDYFLTRATSLWRTVSLATFATESIVRQGWAAQDKNNLHGGKLSGKKLISFYIEESSGEGLMFKIERIKRRMGCRFSDVLFTAVSESIEAQFTGFNGVPRTVSIVIPSRVPEDVKRVVVLDSTIASGRSRGARITKITRLEPKGGLNNGFTVGFLELPVASEGCKYDALKKLKRVREGAERLRHSSDPLVNSWLLGCFLPLLPVKVIKKLIDPIGCTLALSNLPGPKTHVNFGDSRIEDIVFFIPNKEKTGIGLSVLSYAGKLNLGLTVDTALIPDKADADAILNRIVFSIRRMDELCS